MEGQKLKCANCYKVVLCLIGEYCAACARVVKAHTQRPPKTDEEPLVEPEKNKGKPTDRNGLRAWRRKTKRARLARKEIG